MEKAKVYFSREISSENVLRLYRALGAELPGKVAVKVHSGEQGNQNFLRPEFMRPAIDAVGGTVVECNTAYKGERDESRRHWKLLKNHGWSGYFSVDLLDAEGPDMALPVEGGKVLRENYVGKNLANYDSLLVLSHFKGHPMGGFGGALKQLSIGCASAGGKAWIHSGGTTRDVATHWKHSAEQSVFCEAMADAAMSVAKHFEGRAAYVNVMCNLSVDCDCCAVAEDPCMQDIGVLASLDPIALDRACVDLIYASADPGREHFIKRIESRKGLHTIDAAAALGFGTAEYEFIDLDA